MNYMAHRSPPADSSRHAHSHSLFRIGMHTGMIALSHMKIVCLSAGRISEPTT